MKVCTFCKEEKELELFYKQKHGKYGVTPRCKICHQLCNKKSYSKEKAKSRMKKWRETEENRLKSLEISRQWRLDNLAYDAFRAATYRATKNKQTPAWANIEKIKNIYINCPSGYHVDHIIPLRGTHASGLHVETNLQYLLPKENLSKRNLYGW